MANRDPSTGRFTSSGSSGGFSLGSAYAKILISEEDVDKGIKSISQKFNGLGDSIAASFKSVGSSLQSLGGTLTGIGAPFAGLALVAQNAFDEMDDVADQLGAVLKSTGGAAGVTREEALKLGVELQDLTGITRAQIVGGENMLLTFTNIGGKVFPRATKAVVDLSVAMKQDMKSSAIQLGKALNDPITGITALTRVGVTFSQSQKDMIKLMVEAGDVAGAQGIILAEIEKEFGGSAAAAADPIDHLRASLNDLAIDIGVSLQPVLEEVIPIISNLVKSLSQWFTAMSDGGDNTAGILLAIGASLVVLGPIIALIGTAITGIGAALAVLFSPIGLVIGAVIALYVAFQNNFLGIRDFLQPIFTAISNFFANFSDNVKLYGSLIKLYAEYYFQGVVTAIQPIIDKITDFINGNPEFMGALLLAGGAVAILTGVMLLGSLAITAITGAVALLTGGLALLFSPVVLVALAIAGLLYAADKLYPGGLAQLFRDAATAARQLAFLGMYVLATAASWAQQKVQELMDTLGRASKGLSDLQGIFGLLSSGQVSVGDVLNAAGNEINANKGGGVGADLARRAAFGKPKAYGGDVLAGMKYTVGERGAETFTAPANGTITPAGEGGGGLVVNIGSINANSEAGGRAAARGFKEELEMLWAGRGN